MANSTLKPLPILGAGSWGTAIALYLSRLGQEIHLWSCETDHIKTMIKERVNQLYLPNFPFPPTLQAFTELTEALAGTEDILVAVPSVGFRTTLEILKPHIKPNTRILWVTKGLDNVTGKLLHETSQEILGKDRAYATLSGPSFAKEIALGLPASLVATSHDHAFARDIQQRFNTKIFRVYVSHDVVGVEIGGVVKNVMAIATGISDGMNLGANARAALITRGLAEMTRLGLAVGGRAETFTGLTGLGDLVLTCSDDLSRNRRFGLALGQGKDIHQAEREIQQVVEGKQNTEIVLRLAKKHHVTMPITEAVWDILDGKLTALEAMDRILSRAPNIE